MRILIAEDHPELRTLLADFLTDRGHEVVVTRDGVEALRTYLADDKFALIITDYQMPRKDGVALIVDIRHRNPNQKVILVSGDPPRITDALRKEAGEFPILQKPYRTDDLL